VSQYLYPFVSVMIVYFLCPFVSFLVTYFFYRRGKIKVTRKTSLVILTLVGAFLPFVDVIQTLIAIRYGFEGNPLINLTPSEYQFPFLILTHIGWSVFALFLGWTGKSQEKIWARAVLVFFIIWPGLLVVYNVVAMRLHGVF